MSEKLTWNDLLIENVAESDARKWLDYWSGWLTGEVQPVFLSKFGDWFLRRHDGSTDELSVIEGTYTTLAQTPEAFAALINAPDWQEQHLMSRSVYALHQRGLIPPPGQCYGFAPHPVWSGRIDLDHVLLMDLGAWQHICAQTLNRQRPDLNS